MSEAAATPAAPAAPAANNKMMFIMMGVMLVVLFGGMGGMYMMLSSKGGDTAQSDKAGEKSADKGEHADEKKEGEKKTAAIYIGFEPPFVVNFPLDSPVKFLQLTVQIMTREMTVEHEIKGNDPAVRHALLTLFGQQTADKLGTAEGREELRIKALEAVRGVINAEGGSGDKIEAVYFTTFVMQ